MKNLVLATFFMLTACASLADTHGQTQHLMQQALAFGNTVELNDYAADAEQKLLVRLHHVPSQDSTCFIETHGVCTYDYLLSVSTYDEHPVTNVYTVFTGGEFMSANWLPTAAIDTAKLTMTFDSYTPEGLQNNPRLVNKPVQVTIVVSPTAIDKQILGLK